MVGTSSTDSSWVGILAVTTANLCRSDCLLSGMSCRHGGFCCLNLGLGTSNEPSKTKTASEAMLVRVRVGINYRQSLHNQLSKMT